MERRTFYRLAAALSAMALAALAGAFACGGEGERPASGTDLQNATVRLENGGIFHPALADKEVTLNLGTFSGTQGTFSLASGAFTASGGVTIGSCSFRIDVSTFPAGQGPQPNQTFLFDPCTIEDNTICFTTAGASSRQCGTKSGGSGSSGG